MQWLRLAAALIVAATVTSGMAQQSSVLIPHSIVQLPPGRSAQRFCPKDPLPNVVEIREADPDRDRQHHDKMRDLLIKSAATPNTTILLGPNVVLDFTTAALPVVFRACVTLTSTTVFRPDTATTRASIGTLAGGARGTAALPGGTRASRAGPAGIPAVPEPARTPHSGGPLLRFGPHRSDAEKVFLAIHCGSETNDHVRLSGLRIHGPSFGQQSTDEIGIQIFRCLDVEVSNMEIAGWGGKGIHVVDDPEQGAGQVAPENRPGERIGRPDQIRIFRNYIHHNQRPRGITDNHTAGYGVDVDHGAWAQVHENLFDFNRHAIAAAGDTGGYEAFRNLVLKGGGVHFNTGFTTHTHQFDIHGSGGNGFGGQAGVQFWFAHNAFQYLAGPAIEIRGRPHLRISIRDNVFAHEGLEADSGDDAIHLHDRDDRDVIDLGPNNAINFDSYGQYGVCDFDGDWVDDLFLATGQTWWFSSFGEFPWSYLSARTERLNQVRLGYFDDDLRCDVLTQNGADWVIASGGSAAWRSIGRFGAPLDEVAFGRFDPRIRDHRPGATRRTTHAFRRIPNGEWLVTPLSTPAWEHAQSSSFPLRDLRFGDFTGDGVTDVLAVQGGRWSISESARGSWRILNRSLSDDVRTLYVADLNHNNIDDLIRLEVRRVPAKETFTWFVSEDGRGPWRQLKSYTPAFASGNDPVAFAGRFGAAPGGGLLLIDRARLGHFFSEAERKTGASPDWTSLFAY